MVDGDVMGKMIVEITVTRKIVQVSFIISVTLW